MNICCQAAANAWLSLPVSPPSNGVCCSSLTVVAAGGRWYSPDADYVAMYAPVAHTLTVQPEVFIAKFPAWNAEWIVG